MQASIQEKLLSALGAAIVVLLFGYLLLVGMTVGIPVRDEQILTLLDYRAPAPRPRRPPPHVRRLKPARAPGKPSPPNLRNKAAAIVTTPTPVPPPIPSPLVSASKAGTGMAAQSGASDRPGPGEGAGGEGNGTGGGGYGNGDGGGDVPPRLIKGRLKFSDLPADLRDSQIGGTVSVRYSVEVNGGVGDCIVMVSSGNAELDQTTCRLIQQRFRFDPSHDRDGRPVRSMIDENHSWEFDMSQDPRVRR
ncbi:MAG TPA: TonB family protein [Acetobacteraceae bacterium]|nr:TonB family protein [Acetobacteraceae bacterium]